MECQFSDKRVKGQGHKMSKTSTAIWRHVYLRPADRAPAAPASTAGWAWHGVSMRHVTRSNWKDGRIPCRRRHLCFFYFWTRKAVPKSYSGCSYCCCCCCYQFSKGPEIPEAFLIRSGAQQNFAYTFALTLLTDLRFFTYFLINE